FVPAETALPHSSHDNPPNGLSGIAPYVFHTTFDEVMLSNVEETDRALTEQARKRAIVLTQLAAESLVNHMYFHQMDVIADFSQSTRRQNGVTYFYVFDPAGEVVHDGTATIESFGKIVSDEPMRDVRETLLPATWIDNNAMHATAPIMIGSKFLGSVRIGLDLSESEHDKKAIRDLLFLIAGKGTERYLIASGLVVLFLGVAGIGIGIAVTRGTTTDIKFLKTATEEIGIGHYGTDIRVTRSDEIGDLGIAIGKMAGDLRRNEEELRFALQEAETASRAKSEFLSSMSHELRTPMNAILGFAQLLESSTSQPLTEDQKSAVGHILRGGEHLMELITQVLELSKIEAGKLSLAIGQVEARDVIDESIRMIQMRADTEGIDVIDRTAGEELPLLWTDGTRTIQVLLNLLSDAVKFNRVDGTVTVASRAMPGDMLRISVADTGRGVPAERHGELFKPFERLGREAGEIEGSGIGLTISKRIVELLGGQIGFESDLGQGSTFWFDLPVSRQPSAPRKKSRGSADPAGKVAASSDEGAAHTVLYIEDNPDNVLLMESIIERVGDAVLLSAPDAEMGIEIARIEKPDLILMDIDLPGMNGIEALKHLRNMAETKDIPVIAVTAAAMPKDVEEGKKAGFREYFIKPFDISKFNKTIGKILAGHKSLV
ncbi:MAG: ATP-binding protein, partial [Rhodospirillales bacterium]|nr:ATP-binding protein [Rhodospirillales bacterium]